MALTPFPKSLLKISQSPIFTQFLHDCVDELTGVKQIAFDSYNNDTAWTIDEFQQAKTSIQKFYREIIINDKYEPVDNLEANIQEALENCFEIRKSDLAAALTRESLVKNGHNLVENYDWKLKWILGCSQLAAMREPKLQISLYCTGNDKKCGIDFELDTKQLDDLIDQLEQVCGEIK